MPTSTMSAPRRIISVTSAAVVARSGSPAVMNGIRARRSSRRRRANRASMRFMVELGPAGRGSGNQAADDRSGDRLAAEPGDFEGILVAASGQADEQDRLGVEPG